MSKAETDLSFVDRLVEDQIVCWLRLHNNANINYYMYMYISNMHSTYNSLALDVLLVIFHHSQRFFSLCLWSRVSLIECFYYNLLIKGPLSYKSYKVVESFKNLENWQKSLLHSLCNNVICISYVACTFSCAYFEFMMPAACIQWNYYLYLFFTFCECLNVHLMAPKMFNCPMCTQNVFMLGQITGFTYPKEVKMKGSTHVR